MCTIVPNADSCSTVAVSGLSEVRKGRLGNEKRGFRFLRNSGLKADSSLKEIVRVIGEFVMPVVESILKRDTEQKAWQAGGNWKKVSGLDRFTSSVAPAHFSSALRKLSPVVSE
jgi:hypothetical protein